MSASSEPLRILTLCTGNICRSPVAERLLARHLEASGVDAVVRSAGTYAGGRSADRDTAGAAAVLGVDLSDHRARAVDREMVESEGADLVLTMTREHVRHVASIVPTAWRRSFTLKEFVRRSLGADLRAAASFAEVCRAVAGDRRAADGLASDPADDVADPYGRGSRAHSAMVTEVDDLAMAAARVMGAWSRVRGGAL